MSGLRIPPKGFLFRIMSHGFHSVLSLLRNLFHRSCSMPRRWQFILQIRVCRNRPLSSSKSSWLAVRLMYCIHAQHRAHEGRSRIFFMVSEASRAMYGGPFDRSLICSAALLIRCILLHVYTLSRLFLRVHVQGLG